MLHIATLPAAAPAAAEAEPRANPPRSDALAAALRDAWAVFARTRGVAEMPPGAPPVRFAFTKDFPVTTQDPIAAP